MEIQTFFLAEHIENHGGRFHVQNAAFCEFHACAWTKFPARFTLPALGLLRRENSSGEAPLSLRFDLVDEDGRAAGLPHHVTIHNKFTDGQRFLRVFVNILFEFPSIGKYQLDIVADEGQGGVYHYAIEIAGPDGT